MRVKFAFLGCLTALAVLYVFRIAGAQDAPVLEPGDIIVRDVLPPPVSIVSLIATPEKYNHKKVRVVGVVNLAFEGNCIFLHQEDRNYGLINNSLWLNIPSKTKFDADKVNGKYCIVEGVVDSDNHGHLGSWTASITSVDHIELWYDPNKKQK